MTMHQTLPVSQIVERLGREELALKKAGAYAEAAGVRDAVVQVLRMADEGDDSIEPKSED